MPALRKDAEKEETVKPPPEALISANPLRWLGMFGPGIIIASLTIGAGELIFSARAGSLFGYNVLWFFLLALFLKWVLAYSIARQIVLTGLHPFQYWERMRGSWISMVLFIFALACFPIWVAFHSGTLGTLLAAVTGTQNLFGPVTHFVWGIGFLAMCGFLSWRGGYKALEKVQFVIVAIMLLSVTMVAVLLNPDWLAVIKGLLLPRGVEYPSWANAEITKRPAALECITYIGVLGGSSYDYLAYSSYFRDKRWGRADAPNVAGKIDSRWIRAPLIDCTLSFVAVLVFTIVFVICGHLILGPKEQAPSGTNLLTFQASFVNPLLPGLEVLYFLGAFLAIAGTLYGTIEVGPAVAREFFLARHSKGAANPTALRKSSILWVCSGAFLILVILIAYSWANPGKEPPALITILTPANLFTGVLGCGIICLTFPAANRMAGHLKARLILVWLNILAGFVFLGLGLYGYWTHSGTNALLMLGATIGAGVIANLIWRKKG